MEFQTTTLKEVETLLKQGNGVLLDLRTQEEYAATHIEGAKNIPYDDLEQYKAYLPKTKTYILYCERGASSLMAARALSKEGYRVYTVLGGISAMLEQVE